MKNILKDMKQRRDNMSWIRKYEDQDGKIKITYVKETIIGSFFKDSFSLITAITMVYTSIKYFDNNWLLNLMAFTIWLTMMIKFTLTNNITKEEIIQLLQEE